MISTDSPDYFGDRAVCFLSDHLGRKFLNMRSHGLIECRLCGSTVAVVRTRAELKRFLAPAAASAPVLSLVPPCSP